MSQKKKPSTTPKRRGLTAEERADAGRLADLWNEKKGALGLTQVKAAARLGFKNQAAVSQYLLGRIPLNIEAAAKFARLLGVAIAEISPRYAELLQMEAPRPALISSGEIRGKPHPQLVNAFVVDVQLFRPAKPKDLRVVVSVSDLMKPTISAGDYLVVDTSATELTARDQIMLFELNGKLEARRVLVDENVIRVRADSGDIADTVVAAVDADLIRPLGRVVLPLRKVT